MDKKVARRTLGALALAAAAVSVSAHAAAQSFSKSEAILGAPSALEALMAQQGGVAVGQRPAIQPASYSYSRPTIVPAILRVRAPEVSPGVTNGRPDVFGTVALRIGHTPLDARWHNVEHAPVTGAAATFAASQRGKDSVERLEAVNWYVNKRVTFVEDQKRWGRPDVWSTAAETLRSGKGDCEDYAIAKLQMLRRAGFSDRDLYLVVVKDLIGRQDHAVLVVRAEGRMLVLDNGTDRVLDSEELRDYRPILTFASYGTWTHGYRMQSTPVNIASAADSSAAPVAPGAQRSWSASLLAFNTGFSK